MAILVKLKIAIVSRIAANLNHVDQQPEVGQEYAPVAGDFLPASPGRRAATVEAHLQIQPYVFRVFDWRDYSQAFNVSSQIFWQRCRCRCSIVSRIFAWASDKGIVLAG